MFLALTDSLAPLNALSLFSGCGGFCEGMKLAGFRVAAAVEKDKYACESYAFNFPDTKLFRGGIEDFNRLPRQHLEGTYGLSSVDIVFGGPPCQGYSQIGTRDLKDPRNELYREFIKTLEIFRPPVFVMENVPNMLLLKQGLYRDAALSEFRDAGYPSVGFVLLDASEFGVPQQRRRVFYVGVRKDLGWKESVVDFIGSALAPLRVKQATTVWDAIGDLPSAVTDSGCLTKYPASPAKPSKFMREMRLDMGGEVYTIEAKYAAGFARLASAPKPQLANHHTKEIQDRRLKLIKLLKPGAKADSLPKEVWNGARPEKWRRLHPHEPAYTLLAQMHRDLSEWVHPRLQRWITVREALRLQSFHDGFVPVTSEWQQLKQIGNAVPPLLARAVGIAVRELFNRAVGRSPKRTPRQHVLPRTGS
jgi:DNA (cytosine-5)-methyltransferase 1